MLCLALCLGVGLTAIARAANPDTSAAPDPYAICETGALATSLPGGCPSTDQTPSSPNGKTTDLFQQVAGAKYGEDKAAYENRVRDTAITSFDDSLYTVAFSEQQGTGGIAAGATCTNPEPYHESGCKPVLYQRRTFDPAQGEQWRKVDLPGQDKPGYIGKVAWIGRTGRALAVGGTGTYPRREPANNATNDKGEPCNPTDAPPNSPYGYNCDQAGVARAWLYDPERFSSHGGWCELGPSSECGEILTGTNGQKMRGLTALAFDPVPGSGLGFAAGLGQIWTWRGAGFEPSVFDSQSPSSSGQQNLAKLFRFRVRDLGFVPDKKNPIAAAVTDGCCSESPVTNAAALLVFGDDNIAGHPRQWRAYHLAYEGPVTGSGTSIPPSRPVQDAVPLVPNPHPERPDSLYSMTLAAVGQGSSYETGEIGWTFRISALTAPGGPETSGEPPSTITARYCRTPTGSGHSVQGGTAYMTGDIYDYTSRYSLSTARLLSGDGDTAVTSMNTGVLASGASDGEVVGTPGTNSRSNDGVTYCGANEGDPKSFFGGDSADARKDSVPDWVVGELRSTHRAGLGDRGLLVANPQRPSLYPKTLNPGSGSACRPDALKAITAYCAKFPASGDLADPSYKPTDQSHLQAYLEAQYFLLPSYGLDSIDIIGESSSGWAVGDHGAILSLDSAKAAANVPEPEPAKVGARQPGRIPDSSAYGDRSSSTGEPSRVPSLASRPLTHLSEPRLIPAGSPDPSGPGENDGRFADTGHGINEIAMSRDGTEGWAVGPHDEGNGGTPPGAMSVYRYDGGRWTLCDPLGLSGVTAPDPACRSLAALAQFKDQKGNSFSVKLSSIARVPLEADADPSNDNEFEAVAVGRSYYPVNPRKDTSGNWYSEPAMLRYRDGRWRQEDPRAMAAITDAMSTTGLNSFNQLSAVAFTAPDDGWAMAGTAPADLFHFDGKTWTQCSTSPGGCFDSARRTAVTSSAGGRRNAVHLISAGQRIYLVGARDINNGPCLAVIYHERGAASWRGAADGSDGGYDPGYDAASAGHKATTCPAEAQIGPETLSVAERPDGGGYEGWLAGQAVTGNTVFGNSASSTAVLLRLNPRGAWRPYEARGALGDYLGGVKYMAMAPAAAGGLDAYFADASGRLIHYDSGKDSWGLVAAARPLSQGAGSVPNGRTRALAADGQGGAWLALVEDAGSGSQQFVYHYTDRVHEEVFDEVANPAGAGHIVTAASAGGGGQFWLATDSDLLYRYDRATGWDQVHIGGWDPGRVATKTSLAEAIAVNPQGIGVVVGEGGRIADITGNAVKLDDAAGAPLCSGKPPPCGTGRILRAAAVAPDDGSAMIGGDGLTLMWRSGTEGTFQPIARPGAAAQTTITGISMPSANRAWLTTNSGFVFAGEMASGHWSWQAESYTADGTPLTIDRLGSDHYTALRAIAVDSNGRGLAVGDGGAVLQRTGIGEHPWHRLDSPYTDNFTAVTLNPRGATAGGLIGGERSAIYAWDGQGLNPVRLGEWPYPFGAFTVHTWTMSRPVAGLAILGGTNPGETEAWAAVEGGPQGNNSLLHYASDSTDPLLNPARRADPLPDSQPSAPGALGFGAFGHTLCASGDRQQRCSEMAASTEDYDLYTQGIVSRLAGSASQLGGPQFSLFSGDVSDELGAPPSGADTRGRLKTARFQDFVADPLARAGAPLFGAIGGGDLSGVSTCNISFFCAESNTAVSAAGVSAGENLAWRRGMASMPWPQGGGEQLTKSGDLSFNAVPDSGTSRRPEAVPLQNPADGSHPAANAAGGAPTHYAVDVLRSGQKLARLVFVDSSLGSISASDPIQNPTEPQGQLNWLKAVLCYEGQRSTTGDPCSRSKDERVVVITNTPTYSYGPGGLTGTMPPSDAIPFEQALFDGGVNLVVSGRIGWNGLYYASAPGTHDPAPGGSYPTKAPDPLSGQTKPIPFLVTSGAGRFSQQAADTSASAGFWHGYSVVNLNPKTGDVHIEQRPLLDWISLSGQGHVLRPGQRISLTGFGREPVATNAGGGNLPVVRDDEISNAAITHRFDLVEADPQKPWLPLTDNHSSLEHHYVPLQGQHCDESGVHPVGCIDSQSGQVQAGSGQQERTYALAILSVGDKVATYPLVFEPRPSFRAAPVPPPVPIPPATSPPPQPAPPPPDPPFNPPVLQAPLPPPPLPPQLTLAPPAPPVPPSSGPANLTLFTSPPVLSVAPSVSLFPPSAPVINVAPPTPARPIEKARKVAVQSSGSENTEGGKSQAQSMGGDLANAPDAPDAAMTRHDPNNFTALTHRDQPSAWARDLQWGGGLTLMALVLAFGWITVRPTPRRRMPEVPQPAYSRQRRR